jgi:hypothetical protein
MTTSRHSDAFRAYLDYLCETPNPTRAMSWREWAKSHLGASLMVGLSITLAGCGGESDGESSNTGGVPGTGTSSDQGGTQNTTLTSNGGTSSSTGGRTLGLGGGILYGIATSQSGGSQNTGGVATGGVTTGGTTF